MIRETLLALAFMSLTAAALSLQPSADMQKVGEVELAKLNESTVDTVRIAPVRTLYTSTTSTTVKHKLGGKTTFKQVNEDCRDTDGIDYYTQGYCEDDRTGYKLIEFCAGHGVYECHCSSGFISRIYYACPAGCDAGACLPTTTTASTSSTTTTICYDSDGSIDHYKRGYVMCGGERYDDYCGTDPMRLNEFYCDETLTARRDQYDCAAGCQSGVCNPTTTSTTLPPCYDTDAPYYQEHKIGRVTVREGDGTVRRYDDYCINDTILMEAMCGDDNDIRWFRYDGCGELGCHWGRCSTDTCYETDGGDKPYKKGFSMRMIDANTEEQGHDICNGNRLTEFYCEASGQMMHYYVNCPYGCSGGACQTTTTTTTLRCYDNDGGLDYYTKAYARDKYGNVRWDICATNPPNILSEKYCSGNDVLGKAYECETVCVDGACGSTTTTSSTTTTTIPVLECVESDGGERYTMSEYTVKGSVSYVTHVGASNYQVKVVWDECSQQNPNMLIERRCLGWDSYYDHTYTCDFGCEDGACKTTYCFDSDGGVNPNERGYIEYEYNGYTQTAYDRCHDIFPNDVAECRCVPYEAPGGMCQFVHDDPCPLGCANGACITTTTTTTTIPCIDSDGVDIYNAGYVTRGSRRYDDRCSTRFPNMVMEYYCFGNLRVMNRAFNCSGGCADGRCLPTTTTSTTTTTSRCIDSDGGINHYVKGYVELRDDPNHFKHWDYCLENTTHLREQWCVPETQDRGLNEYPCATGCVDGACNPPTTSTTPAQLAPREAGDILDWLRGLLG